MERPGLRQLLVDVQVGRVDVIIVYKVDRLTRSLADFAKIVDVLDAASASFVSITQAFNTTTSMGRLTLNVLLSFAQFEREVTGERIRDKIAASKKKGMWMGDPVPLGYYVCKRKLVINDAEAPIVRLIFERHQTVGTLRALAHDLNELGIKSKLRKMRDGRVIGGSPYLPGALGHLLRNQIYVGKITHGDQVYPGEHDGIVQQSMWDRSQLLLDRAAARPRTGQVSLLASRISDSSGEPMMATHAIKGAKRYRYYVSKSGVADETRPRWRFPAGDLEAMVTRAIEQFFQDPDRVSAISGHTIADQRVVTICAQVVDTLKSKSAIACLLEQLDATVTVKEDAIELILNASRLGTMLGAKSLAASKTGDIRLELPATLKRRGHELRLVYLAPDATRGVREDRLIRLVASGWSAWEQLVVGPHIGDPTRRSHVTRLAQLRFLAPEIVTAILAGRQPVELTSRMLLRASELPLSWTKQKAMLEFA